MYKLQGKIKPKQVIIAIRSESGYGEPIAINALTDFITKKIESMISSFTKETPTIK